MSAQAGDTAGEGGDFRCERCNHQVRVNKGEPIPRCPACGHTSFDARLHETSGRSARS